MQIKNQKKKHNNNIKFYNFIATLILKTTRLKYYSKYFYNFTHIIYYNEYDVSIFIMNIT